MTAEKLGFKCGSCSFLLQNEEMEIINKDGQSLIRKTVSFIADTTLPQKRITNNTACKKLLLRHIA
jgi:hypothetical protein